MDVVNYFSAEDNIDIPTEKYTNEADGIVFSSQILDSKNTFVLKTRVDETTEFKNRKTGQSYYVRFNSDEYQIESITLYLNKRGYYQVGDTTAEFDLVQRIEDKFVVGEWLIECINNAKIEDLSIDNFFASFMPEHIFQGYRDYFIISLTDRSITKNPSSNLEINEHIGDRVIWSIMTEYFVTHCPVELTQSLITSMHRTYVSKEIQAMFAFSLGFRRFFNTSKHITVDNYEDMFEAFVGALHKVDVIHEINTGVKLGLARNFLNTLYNSINIRYVATIPTVTLFNEYMRLFIDRGEKKLFDFFQRNGIYALKLDENRILETGLKKGIPKSDLEELIRGLKITKRFNQREKFVQLEQFYQSKVTLIENIITEDRIKEMRNEKNMAIFSDEQRDEFDELIGNQDYNVATRNVDGDWENMYWELTINDQIFSTFEMDDAGDPETLLLLMRGDELIVEDQVIEYVTYVNQNEFLETSEGRFFLETRDQNKKKETIIKEISKKFEENGRKNRYFIKMFDNFVEYNPLIPDITFTQEFDFEEELDFEQYVINMFNILDYDFEYRQIDHSDELIEFMGNRAIGTFATFLFHTTHNIMEEHRLTDLNRHYFSKNNKMYYQEKLNCPKSFDYLVGYLYFINPDYCEIFMNYFVLNLNIKEYIPESYYKKVNTICRMFDKDGPKNHFKTIGKKEYKFMWKDETFSVNFFGLDYRKVKELFNIEAFKYLRQLLNPYTISNRLTWRYRQMHGYDNLLYTLGQKDIHDWNVKEEMIRTNKRFTLFYVESDGTEKSITTTSTQPFDEFVNYILKNG